MTAQSYLSRLLLATVLTVLAVVSINFVVDPYGLTNAPRMEGFNADKVSINNYSRLLKKYQPAVAEYDTLIVGNSRVEMGLHPEHACFERLGWSVYNLGLPGAGVRKQLNYALDVLHKQPVQRVLLSVDFSDFVSAADAAQKAQPPLLQQVLGELEYLPDGTANPEFSWLSLQDYYQALFSLDALVASVHTVVAQGPYAPNRTLAGFNPANDFLGAVMVEGPRALFDQKQASLEARFGRRLTLFDAQGAPLQPYEDLLAFLQYASDQGVSITLFTNPFHELYWTLLHEHGQMPLYSQWKGMLSSLPSALPRANISFWDFSSPSPYIHEAVPPAGVRAGPLQWFWEPAHYRKELGDLMIDSMLSSDCGSSAAFGSLIFHAAKRASS